MRPRLAPEAESDLYNIWCYAGEESGSIETADRLTDGITGRFFLLAAHLYAGRHRDQDLRPGLRSFPVGNYVIIYRVAGGSILILRVTWRSRDILGLLGS